MDNAPKAFHVRMWYGKSIRRATVYGFQVVANNPAHAEALAKSNAPSYVIASLQGVEVYAPVIEDWNGRPRPDYADPAFEGGDRRERPSDHLTQYPAMRSGPSDGTGTKFIRPKSHI